MAEPKKRKPRKAGRPATPGAAKPAQPTEPPKVSAPTPPPTPKEEPKSETVYELLTWKGQPLYQCRECPFNVVGDERAFWIHYSRRHLPTRPTPESSAILGPDGKPLTKEV